MSLLRCFRHCKYTAAFSFNNGFYVTKVKINPNVLKVNPIIFTTAYCQRQEPQAKAAQGVCTWRGCGLSSGGGRSFPSVAPNMRPRLRWVAANIIQVDEPPAAFLLHSDTRKAMFKGQSNKPKRVRPFHGNIYCPACCMRSRGLFACFNRMQLVTVSRSYPHTLSVFIPQRLETGHEIGVHSVLARVLASELFGFEVGIFSPVCYHRPCPLYRLPLRCLLTCLVCLPNLRLLRTRWTVAVAFFMPQIYAMFDTWKKQARSTK